MAAITYIASTVLMALLLLAVAGFVLNARPWHSYRSSIAPAEEEDFARLSALAESEATWIAAFVLGAVGAGAAAVLAIGGDMGIGFTVSSGVQTAALAAVAAVVAVAFVFYVFYSSYRTARSWGLQKAAAVMAGAWVLGFVGIAAIVLKLVLA